MSVQTRNQKHIVISPIGTPIWESMEGIVESNNASNLAFKVTHTPSSGTERTGLFTFGTKTLATPALLVHTRFGSPQYLTPDLTAKLSELKAVHINARDLYEAFSAFQI